MKGPARERRLLDLRARIPELCPGDAHAMQQQGAALVDVREKDEIAQGSPVGAHRLGRGFLELRVEEAIPDLDRPVLVMCGGGTRSLFAAEDLLRLGYRDVRSVIGGSRAGRTRDCPSSYRWSWTTRAASATPDTCSCPRWARPGSTGS